MVVYRDDDAGVAARLVQLEEATTELRKRLAEPVVLATFVAEERLAEVDALRFVAESEDDPLRRAAALEQYLAGLARLSAHVRDVEQEIARPTAAHVAFAPLCPAGGHLALPSSRHRQREELERLLAKHGAKEIEVEEGAEEVLQDVLSGRRSPLFGYESDGERRLLCFVQARFLHDEVPMMLRHQAGQEGEATMSFGFQLRCGVPRSLGSFWLRLQTYADNWWYKPIRRIQDFEFGDPPFDDAFVISGDETAARAALGPEQRRTLVALQQVDSELTLNVTEGVACLDSPSALARSGIDRALSLLTHLHRLAVPRHLVV